MTPWKLKTVNQVIMSKLAPILIVITIVVSASTFLPIQEVKASPMAILLTFPLRTDVNPEMTSILVKVTIFPGTPPQTLGLINTKSSGTKNLSTPPSSSMASITPSGAIFLTIETVAMLNVLN